MVDEESWSLITGRVAEALDAIDRAAKRIDELQRRSRWLSPAERQTLGKWWVSLNRARAELPRGV